MADNSNIVLHWEIDNATATFETGKAESGIFDEGGFRWTAAIKKLDETVDFTLQCGVDNSNGPWKCTADMGVFVLNRRRVFIQFMQMGRFVFNKINCLKVENDGTFWWNLTNSHFNVNDKVTFEIRINIISSERSELLADPSKFAAPNNKTDVVLKIGEMKLHVSREYLAVQSPVFDTLFFGDFAEKGKEEVELKGVVYEEFLDLLSLIYLETVDITDRSVMHILKLADQFQMERVLKLSMKHLMESNGIDIIKKLLLADQYRLTSLKDHCLNSFNSATDLAMKLKSSPDFANFSADMKAVLLEQVVKLI